MSLRKTLQAIALLSRAQLRASAGSTADAETDLTEAGALLREMSADGSKQLRVHHWLLSRMLQLWRGNTLSLQQSGEHSIISCAFSNHALQPEMLSLDHWLLSSLLQLWMGNTLALQHACGEQRTMQI